TVLAPGTVDPHFTLDTAPSGILTGTGYYNAPNAIVNHPGVLPPYTLSDWIFPYTYLPSPISGTYTYTTRFILPQCMDPQTASISGRWSTIISVCDLYMNKSAIPVSSIDFPGFNQWTPYLIDGGFLAYPAVNEITFVFTKHE